MCSVYLNMGGQLVLSAAHGLAKDAVGKIRMAIVANLLRACLRVRDRVRDIPLESPPDGR